MKKYLSFIAFAITMVMSSCTNDDITISNTTNFTVDPSSIQGAFSLAEYKKGDLESFANNWRLNILLFVYNEDGNKVAEFSETFSSYIVQMKKSAFLPEGKYTAVAITHISSPSQKLWEVENTEKLEGLRVKNLGFIGNQEEILGTSVEQFVVSNNIVDVTLNVRPAGAIITVLYFNSGLIKDQGYKNLRLLANKDAEYLEFDRSGYSNVIEVNNNQSFDWPVSFLPDEELGADYVIYDYVFMLPMNNVGIGFRVDDINGDTWKFGKDGQIDLKKGSSYYVLIDDDYDDFYMGELSEPLWGLLSYANDNISDFSKNHIAPHAKSIQTLNLSKQITEIVKVSRAIER